MNRFENKVALVTGAGSGMGRATAVLLAKEGAAVTVVGRRANKLAEVVDEITAAGGRALAVTGDVANPDDLQNAVVRTVEEFGALHYAVNNAGVTGTASSLHEESIEDFQRVINTNFSSIFYSLKYEIPAILEAGGGAVVNVSSVFADRGTLPRDYVGSKHGVRGITRSAAAEYGRQGIRINELQPGVILTEMTEGNLEATQEVAERGIPMGRMGTGEEIATAVAFLLSDDASYITGAHLAVDGGFLV
ncbi:MULTISPECIES: SDR family NAD(P)-dependent oxidoreductase [unclassified Curtobacterium]|uniref:SDR family NAD(P)-dependent oxidoreductase n=1 Tax=unclassified Curtobacterium TaxID=257496 RepID=UPI003A8134AF